jgi:hypothetical protein
VLTLVLIGLAVALAIVLVIAGVIFFRAAFWGEKDMADEANGVLTWRPSFVRGEALREWAANTAEQIAQRRLKGERTAATAVQLVTELEEGAVHAMLPLARQAEWECIVPCPENGQGTVSVTAVEVLAIADHLRTQRTRSEQQHIHDRALENARAIAAQRSNDTQLPPLACPLQGEHNVCCAFAARPLHCRPLHAISVAQGMGSRRVQSFGSEDDVLDSGGHEQTVAQGIEIGLARALKSARLDGSRYELNSALAKALEVPNAAVRWARGENVFETCARVDPPPKGA